MKKSNFYLALSLGVITFSLVWLFLVFYSIQGGFGEPHNTPRTIPFFLGICLLILGVIFLVQYFLSYRPKSQTVPFRIVEIRNVFICIISFLIYSFALEAVGFLISTPLIIFFLTRFILKEKSWKLNYLFPIVMTGSIYIIFIYLLQSSLPRGTIIQLF